LKRIVNKGTTLLVDGPASVTVASGRVEAFGSEIGEKAKVVIREGKRMPFVVEETAGFDISLGETGSAEEIEGSTVPASWSKSSDELRNMEMRPAKAVVIGNVDSGKTSFCTYLVNKLVSKKLKVAILDGDVGQSDIGPPSTVSYAFVTRPITDLFSLEAKNAVFIGETSPSKTGDKITKALISLKNEALGGNPDFVVVNTDGWVEGECATNYKAQLVDELDPNIVFLIKQKDELDPLMQRLSKPTKIIVDSPPAIRQRDADKRRSLRELGYIKYLRNAKIQSLSLNWLSIEGNEILDVCKSRVNTRQASKICELLGMKPLQLSEVSDKICIVIGRRRWIDAEIIRKVETFSKKKVVVVRKGEEEGLLAGVYDSNRKFLGVGVLMEIDYLRKNLKISTPVSEGICFMAFGKVRLDKNMKEITIPEETPASFSDLKNLF
jgi:polynucleotide 5'-hydroxyl-kinase GRC3/NOL9